ncbi:uncharacterized protein EI90DRAFT_1026744 [Cantharellus anzutake]|uniref:uncharacterized protein n=1 Tax=Cantharellus anzutake TaxID=1750568 RepID=UPI001903BB66|nr:uncharacterized protein EI90DRAFT_1026744 [Cantharellus anzutake]KAF8331489.1 hypothetical protein EI90DRAFT_1026744 [Cantharellus anzutake]
MLEKQFLVCLGWSTVSSLRGIRNQPSCVLMEKSMVVMRTVKNARSRGCCDDVFFRPLKGTVKKDSQPICMTMSAGHRHQCPSCFERSSAPDSLLAVGRGISSPLVYTLIGDLAHGGFAQLNEKILRLKLDVEAGALYHCGARLALSTCLPFKATSLPSYPYMQMAVFHCVTAFKNADRYGMPQALVALCLFSK